MKKITTVLSDLGNVVVTFDNRRTLDALHRLSRETVEDAMPVDEIGRIVFGMQYGLWNHFDRGLIGREQVVRTVLSVTGVDLRRMEVDIAAAEDAWKDVFALNQPVVDLWKKLRSSGLTLTAVSNIDALRWEQVQSMGVGELFDHLVLSFKEHRLKQDGPQIFEKALKVSGCTPDEAVFIDDREDCLHHAKRLGISTILYDCRKHDFKSLEKWLMLCGVPMLKEA